MRAFAALALLAVCFPAFLDAATPDPADAGDGEPSPNLVPTLSLQGLLPSEVVYHKIVPFPDNPYMMMVLASWTGFQLRITDEETIRSSWDHGDKESKGCFVSCINIRKGRMEFCSNNTRVVSFGVGNVAAKCEPGDMAFRKSKTSLAQLMLYVSGSLSGSTEYINVREGAVRSSCSGMCGFVSSIAVGQSLTTINSLDLLTSSDDAVLAISHIGSISPGPSDGFWVGGIVEKGYGSFQTGPIFELSSNTEEMLPRGFVGYFSYLGTLRLGLVWAQQLGDDRLSDKSPVVGAIAASASCSAVLAGAWEGGSQIFEGPEAVNVTAPEVYTNATSTVTLDGGVSVAAVVIMLPGGCAPSGGAASASVHGITTGGDAVAVSAGQEGAQANVYVAVEGVVDDGDDDAPVIYEAALADGGNGAMVWEQGSDALDLSVPDLERVAGLVYDSKSDNLFLYMQRKNSVCTFGVFSLGDEQTTWKDAYGSGCGCTAGKLGLQISTFKEYLTAKDGTNQMADVSAHGPNKVLGFGLTGNLASPEYCAAPGVAGNKFPVSNFASVYSDGEMTTKTLTDKDALDILDMVNTMVPQGTLGAIDGADDVIDVLQNSRPSNAILAASIKAMTTVLYEALTPGSDVKLTKNLMESILVVIGRVATSPVTSAPMRSNAKALADRLFVGIAKQLQPGEVVPLDTAAVQAVVARSTPDTFIDQLVTESRTASWIIPEDLNNRDILLILEHWSKSADDGAPEVYASEAEKPIEDLTNDLIMLVLDPVTLEPVRKAPSESSLAMFDIKREDYRRRDGILRVADCMRKGDMAQNAPWRSTGCVRKPGLLPRGTNVVWNKSFRLPEERPASEPIWFLTSLDPNTDLKCNTTVLWPSMLAKRDAELGLVFDDVTFEGEGCWWNIPDPFGDWPSPQRGQSCRWDTISQTFVGPDCVIAPDANLGCMCREWPVVSKVAMLPLPPSIYIPDTTYPEAPARGEEFPEMYIWIAFAGFIIFTCAMMYLIFLCNRRRKFRLIARLLQPRYRFQGYVVKGGKTQQNFSRNHDPMKGFKMDNFRDMTWRWSLDTHDFEIIADDLDTFSSLSGWEKHRFEAFRSSASQLLSVVGMPAGRAVLTLPRAESLHWMPNNIIGTSDMDGWRNEVLGTSMIMAYLIKHDILPKDILEQQLERQELYFSGCHPIGFKALINRWRVMLFSDNVGGWEAWFDQAHAWRLIWLQRHDGLWDPCSCFLKAVGADPDPLIAKVHCVQFPPGMQILMGQMPPPIVNLFKDDKQLGLRVWCTCLAKAYLEHSEFLWSDFTGREGENQKEPTLMTVIAKEAMDYHIRSRVTEEWLKKVKVESLGQLIANMEENSKQVVSSFENTRQLRLKAWIMDNLAFIEQKDVMKMEKMTPLDMVTCVTHLRNEHRDFILDRMRRNGEEIDPPTEWMKYTNVLKGSVRQIFSKIFHVHKTLRIFCSSITDGLSLFDRVLMAWTILVTLLGCNTWIAYSRSGECCYSLRTDLDCILGNNGKPTTEFCTRNLVQSYTTPARIRYTQNETQHIDANTPCSWLMDNFKPEGWECNAFPNPHSIAQILLAGLLCNAIVFPFKILLRFFFTFKHYSHTSLWDKLGWVEFLWDRVPIKALRRNATGWNVREATTAVQWSKILPVEDHFALDNTTIKDLEVSDNKVVAAATPVKARHHHAPGSTSKASSHTEASGSRNVPGQKPPAAEGEDTVQPREVHVGGLMLNAPTRGYAKANGTNERLWTRGRRSSGAHVRGGISSVGEDEAVMREIVVPSLVGRARSTSQVPSSSSGSTLGGHKSAAQVPSFLARKHSDHT